MYNGNLTSTGLTTLTYFQEIYPTSEVIKGNVHAQGKHEPPLKTIFLKDVNFTMPLKQVNTAVTFVIPKREMSRSNYSRETVN